MIPDIPVLRILPIEKIILHEEHDTQRSIPLMEKLRAQSILRNPPIVMPLNDHSTRYMVLDGANRVTAMREMMFPHILAQVVTADDPDITLRTWNHITWGMTAQAFLKNLRRIKELDIQRMDRAPLRPPGHISLQILTVDGALYACDMPSSLKKRVHALHEIVNTYKARAYVDRTNQVVIDSFKAIYPDLTALIVFPRFEITEALELAGHGWVVPAGITRFTVNPRALRVNYPLHELASGKTIKEKEAYLQDWLRECIRAKRVRHYPEATFLFDE